MTWMLYHIRATNGLWVPSSSTWRRTTSTRSSWCRASRTWSSRSLWYSRNIFLLSYRSARSYKYSKFFTLLTNILSITCRRSSALSFRWTRPARCLSHIGTYQLLQCCIMYFAFCILYFWNTNIKHHIGTYINPVGWRNHFQMPFLTFVDQE